MFNFTAATRESHDAVRELFERFSKNFPEGLSLDVSNGEFHVTDSKTGALYFSGEMTWEVDDYLTSIDNECLCDGAEPVYLCSFPPCVAEREAEGNFYGAMFRAAQSASDVLAYDRNNPKHPNYAETIIDRIDEGRI